MEDVARAAGVSRALVSIAYRGVTGVSDDTREHIFTTASQLGYRPNRVASRLAGRGGNTIGVFLLDLHNDLFADVYDGIRAVTGPAGKHVVLSVSTTDGKLDEFALDTLLQSRVDIVIAAGMLLPDRAVHRFADSTPLVSVTRDVPGVDGALSDNGIGAELATRHLLGLGHTDIAFLANPQTDGYRDRQRGYESAMRTAGHAPRVVPSAYSRTQAAADAIALLEDARRRPTAIFAHNDQAALGALDAMATLGLSREDVSVVGYDNSTISSAPGTALTTVDIHARDIGRAAAEIALERLAAPDGERIVRTSVPTLIERGTTTAPRRS